MAIQSDILNRIFGMEFMDSFHDYGDIFSNVRYYHRQKARICRDFILQNAGMDKNFLDAGAGRGPYTKIAESQYKKIYCFEFDGQELEKAKKNLVKIVNVDFGQVDLTRIPLADNLIDVVVCSEVVEHIPDQEKAMNELYRVLKPGGTMLFSMPNKNSLFYRKVRKNNLELMARDPKNMNYSEWEFWRHLQFSPEDIERLATGSGFKVLERDSVNLFPLPYSSRKFLMQKFTRGFKMYDWVNRVLSNLFPYWGSFYFLILEK